jgi:lipopolysaccharide export system protein LptA
MNLRAFSLVPRPAVLRRAVLPLLLVGGLCAIVPWERAIAQSRNPKALQLRGNLVQANAKTGVAVASGNVQIDYPARDIKATAAQATYYSQEGRMVLSGNVYILQEGNSMRGEVITYFINEGRFDAAPQSGKQVEAIYLLPPDAAPVPKPQAPAATVTPAPAKQPFPMTPGRSETIAP